MAVLGGVVGGATFIHPEGVDFLLLEPLWLAVALFALLPAAYGALLSVLVERWLAADSRLQTSRFWLIGLIPLAVLALTGVAGLGLVVGMVVLWALGWLEPGLASAWRSRPITWVGRAFLMGLTGYALVTLVDDVGQIL